MQCMQCILLRDVHSFHMLSLYINWRISPFSPDDPTVVISKMLSWLLRHGIKHKSVMASDLLSSSRFELAVAVSQQAMEDFLVVCAKVGLTSDSADGWVKVNDVLASDYFKDMTREILMKARGLMKCPCFKNPRHFFALVETIAGDCRLKCAEAPSTSQIDCLVRGQGNLRYHLEEVVSTFKGL